MKLKKIVLAILLTLTFLYSLASAGEPNGSPAQPAALTEEDRIESAADEKYLFPAIPPEVHFSGGYRFVSSGGAATADEYEYLHNSILFGGDVRYFSFPHRFHLNFDIENGKSYYGDISYAYEDMVIFRGINRTLYHNLDKYRLYDDNPANSDYRVAERDSDNNYGVKVGMNNIFVRFKTHDFPFHVYVEGGLIDRRGSQQQISYLNGSSSPRTGYRTSLPRDIDFQTKTLTVGANSHLGPVEIDISHGEKRFTVSGDSVMYDSYAAVTSGNPPVTLREGGVYPHNLIPEIKSSSNTIKFHTSFTGGIVASATFSKIERENQDSGARASLLIGAGDLSWTASPRLAFFLKYRYRDTDVLNPDQVRITDRVNTLNSYLYPAKDSISSVTNAVTGIVRYRLLSGIVIKGEYTYEDIHRSEVDGWGSAVAAAAYKFPESTTKSTESLSADLRLIKGLNLKLKYTHKNIDNPAYNVEPDTSDEGKISVSWVPSPRISTMLSYGITKEKRTNLEGLSTEADDRKVLRDRLFGSVTFLLLRDLSLTTSYSYMHNKIEQDIAVGAITDSMVPNKIFAHTYGIDLNYTPLHNFSLGTGVSHTLSSGTFFPSSSALLNPSIGVLSELRAKETVVHASGEYRFKRGFSFGIQYKYTRLDDVIDNKYDDVTDGKVHVVFLTVSKKW